MLETNIQRWVGPLLWILRQTSPDNPALVNLELEYQAVQRARDLAFKITYDCCVKAMTVLDDVRPDLDNSTISVKQDNLARLAEKYLNIGKPTMLAYTFCENLPEKFDINVKHSGDIEEIPWDPTTKVEISFSDENGDQAKFSISNASQGKGKRTSFRSSLTGKFQEIFPENDFQSIDGQEVTHLDKLGMVYVLLNLTQQVVDKNWFLHKIE